MTLSYVHAGDAYFDWVMDISDHLHNFVTLTFTWPPSYMWAFCRGVKMWRLTNEYACGRRFREHGDGLTTVFAVEAEHARPHIHMMQEASVSLTNRVYIDLWRQTLRHWVSEKAINVDTTIRSKSDVASYILKSITWEQPPFIYIPKKYRDLD